MLGARTSRPHCPQAAFLETENGGLFFALRAQCGRDVRAPSIGELPIFGGGIATGNDFE